MPDTSYRKILKSIYLNLITLLGIILLGGILVMVSFNSQEILLETSDVRNQLLEVEAAILDAESKNKTYLITKQKVNRDRYRAAVILADLKMEKLQNSAIAVNEEQTANFKILDSLYALKKAEMNEMLALRIQGDEQETVDLVTSTTRLALKHDIETIVRRMLNQNEFLFKQRDSEFKLLYYTTIFLLLIGVGYMIYGLSRVKNQLIPVFYNLENSNEILNKEIEKRTLEIKLKEEQMSINEKLIHQLREKNKELNQFAYIASHDLQEPLRTVDNFVTIFEEDYSDKLDDDAHDYFNFIKGATSRMRALINGLLQYSRIGKSGALEPVDLNEIIEEIRRDFVQRIEETDAEITSDELPTLNGYRLELKQLFFNLIGNSLKFVKEGVAPKISIEVYESENNYQFTISDNGIGIPEKYLSKIFEMFTRLHSETSYSGQGIGLAFCKKITELHDGIISVDSEEGVGTSFIVILNKNLEEQHE